MKPLTANDLVIGGKYVIKWLGDNYIVTYDGCGENEYNFVSEKRNFFMHPRDIHHVTPYHEPNECCGRCDGVNDFCINDESTMMELKSLHEPNQTTMDYTEQPFNLETALKHPEWVRTRDGREIDFIKEYDKAGTQYVLSAVLKDGRCFSYNKQGQFNSGDQCLADLILRVPYVTKFANIYYKEPKIYFYDSEQEANDQRSGWEYVGG
jgi:hypothetical protein